MRVWIWVLALAKQALYNFSHISSSPSCFSYFSNRFSWLCPGWLGLWLPYSCSTGSWDDRHAQKSPVGIVEIGSQEFSPQADFKLWSSWYLPLQ
jgi:hypothetical protein